MPARTTDAGEPDLSGLGSGGCGLVLGVESSCDETGVALVRAEAGSRPALLAHSLHTQIDLHRAYGGVVPELASRDHIRRVVPLVRQVLTEAGCGLSDIAVVAYTAGPGLAGALLVGAAVAQGLALALQRPVLPVHHLEGHLLSPFLSSADPPEFPFVGLLVSGGHTQLMRVERVGSYELLGESIDDAAGEAFDKCAMLLGLGYPGGAALSELASHGKDDAYAFPRPLLNDPRLDFSFAGLKTSVATQVRKLAAQQPQGQLTGQLRADIAASAQAAIVEVLVRKSILALESAGLDRLVVAGGVGANGALRKRLRQACAARSARLHFPEPQWCTDNGAMIALAAAMRLQAGIGELQPAGAFEVRPRWVLG